MITSRSFGWLMLELTLTIAAGAVVAEYPKTFIEKYVRLPNSRFALL
jgi:hypothetical protein